MPVFSGIGHEINITITDLAAHTYQKTPTATAQLIIGLVKNFLDSTQAKVEGMIERGMNYLRQEKRHLRNNALDIQNSTDDFLKQHHLELTLRQQRLKQNPLQLLEKKMLKIAADHVTVVKDIRNRFKMESVRLKNVERLVGLASPMNTMKRGFSIARLANGTLLRSVKQCKPKDTLVVELFDGKVTSTVD